MKKIMLMVLLLVAANTVVWGQSTYTKNSNGDFQAVKTERKAKASTYTPTGKYYVDTDSVRHEIYLHTITKGDNAGKQACYIQKVSKKTGKSYWKKIDVKPEELK